MSQANDLCCRVLPAEAPLSDVTPFPLKEPQMTEKDIIESAYEETLKIVAFYGALSLIFILLIISAYRRMQHNWL